MPCCMLRASRAVELDLELTPKRKPSGEVHGDVWGDVVESAEWREKRLWNRVNSSTPPTKLSPGSGDDTNGDDRWSHKPPGSRPPPGSGDDTNGDDRWSHKPPGSRPPPGSGDDINDAQTDDNSSDVIPPLPPTELDQIDDQITQSQHNLMTQFRLIEQSWRSKTDPGYSLVDGLVPGEIPDGRPDDRVRQPGGNDVHDAPGGGDIIDDLIGGRGGDRVRQQGGNDVHAPGGGDSIDDLPGVTGGDRVRQPGGNDVHAPGGGDSVNDPPGGWFHNRVRQPGGNAVHDAPGGGDIIDDPPGGRGGDRVEGLPEVFSGPEDYQLMDVTDWFEKLPRDNHGYVRQADLLDKFDELKGAAAHITCSQLHQQHEMTGTVLRTVG